MNKQKADESENKSLQSASSSPRTMEPDQEASETLFVY